MASDTPSTALVTTGAHVAEVAPQPSRLRSNSLWRVVSVGGRVLGLTTASAIQLMLIYGAWVWAADAAAAIRVGSIALSAVAIIYILNSRIAMDYKLMWVLLILILPALGGFSYLLFGMRPGTGRLQRRQAEIKAHTMAAEVDAPGVVDAVRLNEYPNPRVGQQTGYLASVGPFVAFENTETTYYSLGEDAFPDMLAAVETAEHYILLEYFIVNESHMWEALFSSLARKSAEGVDVMFMYDDLGSLWNLPTRLVKRCKQAGIKVKAVNRLGFGLNTRLNNRDHRKLLIVDGKVGFTGGINISDEYINIVDRFGQWKDTVIRLEGPGVWGMVGLFFSLWDQLTGQNTEFAHLRPDWPDADAPGLVVSYDDSPFDSLSVGWAAYNNMMTRARHTVDIMTPYLIPSQDQLEAIAAVARSGVRVRLVTPGVPDKRLVFQVTRSNYAHLIDAGVEIYEFTPGFLHAKQMVVDDNFAIIGTVNFDFRSFYLHQECAVWMYDTAAIPEMIRDIDETIARCRRITAAEVNAVPLPLRVLRSLLRTFAPML